MPAEFESGRGINYSDYDLLGEAEQELVGKLSFAMAEKFNLNPKDFSAFLDVTKVDPVTWESTTAVVYTASEGIYRGSGKDIFTRRKRQNFIVKLDEGQEFDTRLGMTQSVYEAMVKKARSEGRPLPDTETRTFITGERSKRNHWSWVMSVDHKGAVLGQYVESGHPNTYNRFRPAAVIYRATSL